MVTYCKNCGHPIIVFSKNEDEDKSLHQVYVNNDVDLLLKCFCGCTSPTPKAGTEG